MTSSPKDPLVSDIWPTCSSLIAQEYKTDRVVVHPLDNNRLLVNDDVELEKVTPTFPTVEDAVRHKAAVDLIQQQLAFQTKPSQLVQPIQRILKCVPKPNDRNAPEFTLLYERPIWFKMSTFRDFLFRGRTLLSTTKDPSHPSVKLWTRQFSILMKRWIDSMMFCIITLGMSFGDSDLNPFFIYLIPHPTLNNEPDFPMELGLLDPLDQLKLKQTEMNDITKMGYWICRELHPVLDYLDIPTRTFVEIMRGPMNPLASIKTEKLKLLSKEDNQFLLTRLASTTLMTSLIPTKIDPLISTRPAYTSPGNKEVKPDAGRYLRFFE